MQSGTVQFVEETEVREAVCAAFESVRAVLEGMLPNARIEHIGSTAVPGSITKGDLDVCVLVRADAFARAERTLAQRFGRNVGSDRTDSFASFLDENAGDVPIGIQLVARGGAEDDFVRWRELLRRSPQVLEAYNDLKRHWHGGRHDEYRIAKARFIEDALSASPPTDAG